MLSLWLHFLVCLPFIGTKRTNGDSNDLAKILCEGGSCCRRRQWQWRRRRWWPETKASVFLSHTHTQIHVFIHVWKTLLERKASIRQAGLFENAIIICFLFQVCFFEWLYSHTLAIACSHLSIYLSIRLSGRVRKRWGVAGEKDQNLPMFVSNYLEKTCLCKHTHKVLNYRHTGLK